MNKSPFPWHDLQERSDWLVLWWTAQPDPPQGLFSSCSCSFGFDQSPPCGDPRVSCPVQRELLGSLCHLPPACPVPSETPKLLINLGFFFWGVLKHEQFLRRDHGAVMQCWHDRGKRCSRKEGDARGGKNLAPVSQLGPHPWYGLRRPTGNPVLYSDRFLRLLQGRSHGTGSSLSAAVMLTVFSVPDTIVSSWFSLFSDSIFNNERSNSTVKLQLGSSLPSQCVEGLGIGLISAAVTGWCSWFSASLCCWVFFHYHCTPGSFALLSYFWSYLLVSFSVPLKVFWSVFF